MPTLLFRSFITALGVISLLLLIDIFLTGRTLARSDDFEAWNLKRHRFDITWLWRSTLGTIAVVEGIGRAFHLLHHTHLFWIHLCACAIPFLILLPITNFWLTGRRYPRIHRWPARLCLVTGVLTNVLGIILAFQ